MKTRTMNISLPSELARYVKEKVENGQYSSASEVVREALRRLAEQESAVRRENQRRALSGAVFDAQRGEEAIRAIREIQKQHTLGDWSIEDLINEGREA